MEHHQQTQGLWLWIWIYQYINSYKCSHRTSPTNTGALNMNTWKATFEQIFLLLRCYYLNDCFGRDIMYIDKKRKKPGQEVLPGIVTEVWSGHSEVLDEAVHRVAQQLNNCEWGQKDWGEKVPQKWLLSQWSLKNLKNEDKKYKRMEGKESFEIWDFKADLKLLSGPLQPSRHLDLSFKI